MPVQDLALRLLSLLALLQALAGSAQAERLALKFGVGTSDRRWVDVTLPNKNLPAVIKSFERAAPYPGGAVTMTGINWALMYLVHPKWKLGLLPGNTL